MIELVLTYKTVRYDREFVRRLTAPRPVKYEWIEGEDTPGVAPTWQSIVETRHWGCHAENRLAHDREGIAKLLLRLRRRGRDVLSARRAVCRSVLHTVL